jgi:hypothetical protein
VTLDVQAAQKGGVRQRAEGPVDPTVVARMGTFDANWKQIADTANQRTQDAILDSSGCSVV